MELNIATETRPVFGHFFVFFHGETPCSLPAAFFVREVYFMHNPEKLDLRTAVSALQARYRAPVEHRKGASQLLVFHPKSGTTYPGFEVYFKLSTAIAIVDGTKFMFSCPVGEKAYRAFSDWKRLDVEEYHGWLKSPSYVTLVGDDPVMYSRYRTAVIRIVLAAFYATIIQRSRNREGFPPRFFKTGPEPQGR